MNRSVIVKRKIRKDRTLSELLWERFLKRLSITVIRYKVKIKYWYDPSYGNGLGRYEYSWSEICEYKEKL